MENSRQFDACVEHLRKQSIHRTPKFEKKKVFAFDEEDFESSDTKHQLTLQDTSTITYAQHCNTKLNYPSPGLDLFSIR